MRRRRRSGSPPSRRGTGQSAPETLVVAAVVVTVFLTGRPNLVTRLIQALQRLHQDFLTSIALP